jgi:hypothetical protein
MKVIEKSNSKLLHCLPLGRAGLAAALTLLLLGAGTPQLVAQSISDIFDADGSIPPGPDAPPGWTAYSLPNYPDFGYGPEISEATYSFPTNTAGPAGNYAFRIQAPAIPFDYAYGVTRAGAFRTDATYGNAQGSSEGRFIVAADLVKWTNNWAGQVMGLAWYVNGIDNVNTLKGYVVGWGPDIATLGIIRIDLGLALSGGIEAAYKFVGNTPEGSTLLDPTRQYKIVASTSDGTNFLATLYDKAQPDAPWVSAIGWDDAYSLTPGYCGIFEANTDTLPGLVTSGDNSTDGADSTWDNYSSSWPNPNATPAASLPATVTALLPKPAGSGAGYYPQGRVNILNRDSNVKLETIGIYMDGLRLPNSALWISNYVSALTGTAYSNYPGAMVFWTITNLFAGGSWHTNKVVFQDDYNTTPSSWHTNVWSWTSATPKMLATNGSLNVRGFDSRLVMSYNPSDSSYANIAQGVPADLPNSIDSAWAVLNYQYPVNFAATNITPLVNYSRNQDAGSTNFPGMCWPAPDPAFVNSYAVDVLAYLALSAGTNSFRIEHDDGVAVYTGTSPTDTSMLLASNNGTEAQNFDFVVLTSGLYPIHIVFEEGGGGSYLSFYSWTNSTSTRGPLVGSDNGIKAYYPLVIMSATAPDGPYTVDAYANAHNALQTVGTTATCDSGKGPITNYTVTGGTLTLPLSAISSSSQKYYRLSGPRASKFLAPTNDGTNLIIPYQAN